MKAKTVKLTKAEGDLLRVLTGAPQIPKSRKLLDKICLAADEAYAHLTYGREIRSIHSKVIAGLKGAAK